jgi:formylglycine-generating enzyme required for sulfatase activity
VNLFEPSPMGFYDVHGNAWEWAEDEADGLPGFKV